MTQNNYKINKNPIQVGDRVVFLYCQFLEVGTVLKINKKSIKVHSKTPSYETIKNIKPERVANIKDSFCVVWDSRKGVEGSYRIDYITYPDKNSPYTNWSQPYQYINE